ncbi:MAG: hypothetical protein OXH92_12820 [Bryobacterales bacterium]|nr:hypothetical protein [Bryobacterales bacterium]
MAKSCVVLLSVVLLAAPAGRAETVLQADWEKARAMLTQGEFRSRIAVELKSSQRVMAIQGSFHDRKRTEVELKPNKWLKGKLIEVTGEGLQVEFRRAEIGFQREDISRIRLVPRTKHRWVGLVLGVPAGIGAGFLASLYCCFLRDGGSEALGYVVLVGTPMLVPYVFHKLWGGGHQAVVVVLDESTANKPQGTSQEAGPSPAKPEDPGRD